jgi:uncharacterized protein
MRAQVSSLIDQVVKWAQRQPDVSGVLLVGSYATGNSRPQSDVDLMVLSSNIQDWLTNTDWLNEFGKIENIEREDWGMVKTLRTFYLDGLEVEFNIAPMSWASIDPIDPGTFRVVFDGVKVLFDPTGELGRLVAAVGVDTQGTFA